VGGEFGNLPVTSESAPVLFSDSISGEDNRNAITALLGVESLHLLHATFPLQSRAPTDHVDLREYLALLASVRAAEAAKTSSLAQSATNRRTGRDNLTGV
jgi:hypothetical protein